VRPHASVCGPDEVGLAGVVQEVDRPVSPAEAKERRLLTWLSGFDSLVVAFSGGADSTYLAWAATRVLGNRAFCITADSPSFPDRHRQLARAVAAQCGFHHELIFTRELERAEYRTNPVNRCYYCKQELYGTLIQLARARGIAAVVDGNNADDRGDYRPGRQAGRELGIRSPLDETDLYKSEIRELSRRVPLPTWDEPASACLSSRIPYHSAVTSEKLRMIERAEHVLRDAGFRVCRVRHHDMASADDANQSLARVEIGRDELPRALISEIRTQIDRALRDVGYDHVIIDPRGYRMGSLNRSLRLRVV
jgi:pyridinium-3,5-biscarboxylic acid mononucleotide sulfurtransferase